MGHGRFDTAIEMPIPDTVLTDGTNGQIERAELKDVNGDGLADLVVERAQANALWYWLNLGTDAFSDKYIVTDMGEQKIGIQKRLIVYREEPVVHPVTGKMLGADSEILGHARIKQVSPEMSKAELIEEKEKRVNRLDKVITQ